MKYDVIVIGAGVAGLFSALSIKNKKVLLLEKNSSAGKKLLISGAGQCNYTNNCEMSEFIKKYGDKGRFVKAALYNFTNKDAMEFFEKHGVPSTIREDNKVFPSSFKASDIVDALVKSCSENNAEIIFNESAEKITFDENNKMFFIKTSKNSYASEKLIITAGGKSYSNTGSTGDGYSFARSMGHRIVEPKQALVPVYVENYKFKDLSGISFENIKITLWRNNKKINEFNGDLLFTHVNISGPVILNNSRYIEKGDILKINFTQFSNSEEFKKYFEDTISGSGKLNVKTVLKQFDIPKRFIDKIMELSGVDDSTICSQLDKNSRKKLIEIISNYALKVEKLGDFNIAMVTKGGVSTDQINSKTMESKIVPNLYFAGEVIDYDGDTGGFNIQAAFSTGKMAADSINKIK
ncbi:MAG: NAD(P)/FAD-dependent oxidoreductase [Sedimentibacter sp.]|uniref:NAD(P)/FAD-dependent oxidoreductase n=1 Tax=Sedimentibacter sp. TaxID=1960295 RepID=UPI0029827098|nr:NAD(P)/FAD-dependent oxidoreductase [Sedimentibacter sp.]MDW5300133.1 NAD(P)/FAD-dependent oxidoreductase [Sedimentibacter sp.]